MKRTVVIAGFVRVGMGALLLLQVGAPPAAAQALPTQTACTAAAQIMSATGTVEVLAGESWQRARTGENLCAGQSLRTGSASRALIYLTEKKTFIRLDAETRLQVSATPQADNFLVRLMNGLVYFFSRTPVRLDVDTPHVNGGIEGTEFLLYAAREESDIVVYEGRYGFRKADDGARYAVDSRQAAEVTVAGPPKIVPFGDIGKLSLWRKVVAPADLTDWVLYYPPLVATSDDPRLAAAQSLLASGRVDEFRRAVAGLPASAARLSLESIVATVNARTPEQRKAAIALARRALESDAGSRAAHLALSYALQGDAQVEAALSLMRAAPGVAAWPAGQARLAELYLVNGRVIDARRAALRALTLDPALAHAHALLGFAELAYRRPKAASRAFSAAIAADADYPEARLGLGLALIHKGLTRQGMVEIETATVLDANRSLLRSYLGRAYLQGEDITRAHTQYGLAKERDANDPTPWLLDAERLYREGEPIAALRALQYSLALNEARGATRSANLLATDRAQREALIGSVYADLGLQEAGIFEIGKALFRDPSNASAHRALAAFYADDPDRDRIRSSALLQARLRRPLSHDVIPVHALERDLVFLGNNLSSAFGEGEYFSAFDRDGVSARATGQVGSFDTYADELDLSLVKGAGAFKAAQFHYETGGFRPNADIEHDIWNLFAAVEPAPFIGVQAEVRHRETVQGDIVVDFDPNVFSATQRQTIEHDVWRFGAQMRFTPDHTLLVNYSRENFTSTFMLPSPGNPLIKFATRNDLRADNFQAQLTNSIEQFNLVSGIEYLSVAGFFTVDINITGLFGGTCPIFVPTCLIRQRTNVPDDKLILYSYANLDVTDWLGVTAGLNYTRLEGTFGSFDRLQPKFGVQIDISPRTTITGVIQQYVASTEFIGNTLEPTHIMDIGQFRDQLNAAKTTSYDGKIHQRWTDDLSTDVYGGHVDIGVPARNLVTGAVTFNNIAKNYFGAETNYVFGNNIIASVAYDEERDAAKTSTFVTFGVPYLKVVSRKLPLEIKYFHEWGLGAGASLNIMHQRMTQAVPRLVRTSTFALVDLSAGWRDPRGHFAVNLEARNLLDKHFNYQNQNLFTEDLNSAILVPERMLALTASMRF
jgi:hypothetical protein